MKVLVCTSLEFAAILPKINLAIVATVFVVSLNVQFLCRLNYATVSQFMMIIIQYLYSVFFQDQIVVAYYYYYVVIRKSYNHFASTSETAG